MKIGTILVPVDFSPAARRALDFAVSVAPSLGADLALVSVIEEPSIMPYFPGTVPEASSLSVEGVRARLEEQIASETRRVLNCRFVATKGAAEEEILSAIAHEEADLVIMGTHGRRAFRRWFLGSVTEHILRRVPIPILTISHPEDRDEPWSVRGGQILYATDLSEGSGRGMELAYEFAERFDANLTILHALHTVVEFGAMYPAAVDHEQLKKAARELLEESTPEAMRTDPRVRLRIEVGAPHAVILDTAKALDANLIVVNLHGKGRMERALLGATAERVVRSAHPPVLSIPLIHS